LSLIKIAKKVLISRDISKKRLRNRSYRSLSNQNINIR